MIGLKRLVRSSLCSICCCHGTAIKTLKCPARVFFVFSLLLQWSVQSHPRLAAEVRLWIMVQLVPALTRARTHLHTSLHAHNSSLTHTNMHTGRTHTLRNYINMQSLTHTHSLSLTHTHTQTVHTDLHPYPHTHTPSYMHRYTHTHKLYTLIYIHIHTHTLSYMHRYIRTRTHTPSYMHRYIRTHTHTHTKLHAQIYTDTHTDTQLCPVHHRHFPHHFHPH